MRIAFLIIAALAGISALNSTAAQAQGRDYPYCLKEGGEAGPGTCYYTSYAQCQASASGRYAYCYTNPRLSFGLQQRWDQQRLDRRRGYNY